MTSKNEIIKQLKQIIKESQILTDLEDRYVYSFEKIFLDQSYPKPDIVVRTSSLKEENDILDFIEKENVKVIKRGQEILHPYTNSSNIIILLDNVKIPSLESCTKEIGEKNMLLIRVLFFVFNFTLKKLFDINRI